MSSGRRELSDKFKISVRSVGEVVEVFSAVVGRLRTKEVTFQGKRVTREAVASALFLYLGKLSESDQERVLSIGLAELERILSGEDPAASPKPKRIDATVVDATEGGSVAPDASGVVRKRRGG